MLPLAWILGFNQVPKTDGMMMDGEPIGELITQFIGDLDQDLKAWLATKTLRPLQKIVEMEDRFYCAHNAVRSAQLGHATVPKQFHPMVNGGVIHERRHALTWALSPGVAWDDTALST